MFLSIGFIALIISVLAWGSYFVPIKKIKNFDPLLFQWLMAISIFLSSVVFSFLIQSFIFSWYGLMSGIILAISNVLSIYAVRNIGLARSYSIWTVFAVATNILLGLVFFNEKLSSVNLALIGVLFLLAGLVIVAFINKKEKSTNIVGFILAALSGFGFSVYIIPIKLIDLTPQEFLFSTAMGILVCSSMIYIFKKSKTQKKLIIPGLVSGLIWNIANFSTYFVMIYLGLAIGLSLTRLSLFVSLLWGVFYFKEISGRRKITRLAIGAIIIFIGAMMLLLSR